jgi:hypothetical protein
MERAVIEGGGAIGLAALLPGGPLEGLLAGKNVCIVCGFPLPLPPPLSLLGILSLSLSLSIYLSICMSHSIPFVFISSFVLLHSNFNVNYPLLCTTPTPRARSERRQHRQHNARADHRQGSGSRQEAASLPTHGQGQPWAPDGTGECHRGDGCKRQGHISRSCMDARIHRYGQLSCPPSCVSFPITSSV